MTQSRKQVIEKVNDAFAHNDIEAFLAYCHDDFVWTMIGAETVKGKDAIRKFMSSGPSTPPNFNVQAMIADGDYVSAMGDMTMKESGHVVPYAYCDVWRFRGDKIAELKAYVIKTHAVTT